jgi:uncharacterized protein YndB with AHSA1/START domain
MTTTPNGRLHRHDGGADLIVSRSFRAGLDDVWAGVTEPERTARWYGPWRGEAAPGRTIQVQMAYEEGAPWFDMRIEVCEPPRRLVLTGDGMTVELSLTHDGGRTELSLTHQRLLVEHVPDYGPGWEYYLDMLAASREDRPLPSFDDYPKLMTGYYRALIEQPA